MGLERKCESCGLEFSNENEKIRHVMEVHDTEKSVVATCPLCGKTYKSLWGYRYHQKSHERTFGKTTGDLQCRVCGKFFQSLFYLQRHLKSHSTERPFTCSKCGRSYKHTSGLKLHHQHCRAQFYDLHN